MNHFNPELPVNTSKVEIRPVGNQLGIFSLGYFAAGSIVFTESVSCSYTLTSKDAANPASDACFFVREVLQSPRTTGKKFFSLGLKSIEGVLEIPPNEDKYFLKKIAKKHRVSYDKVLEIWRVICTFNVKMYYIPHQHNIPKVRLQLSKLFNYTNHHCAPNAEGICQFSDSDSFSKPRASVRAIRDIVPGEEVTFSYIDEALLLHGVEARRKYLWDLFGFRCQCEKCVSEASGVY